MDLFKDTRADIRQWALEGLRRRRVHQAESLTIAGATAHAMRVSPVGYAYDSLDEVLLKAKSTAR